MNEKNKYNELKQVSYNSLDDLYKDIDEKGSLGLLALGYKGLLLWRKRREELSKSGNQKKELDEG